MYPNATWSEGIVIEFTSWEDLIKLVEIHLLTHASTSMHSRRAEYRSALYFYDTEMKEKLETVMSTLSRKQDKNYITAILPFVAFRPSRESLQDYYRNRPEAPFCQRYIVPKLKLIEDL